MTPASQPTAVVTGGASGIGAATCRMLVERGWGVGIADRDADRAERLARELLSNGARAVAVELDVTSSSSVRTGMKHLEAELRGVHALVCSAGFIDPAPSVDVTDASLRRVLDVHLEGSIRCAQAVHGAMVRAGGGAIVCLSSINAHVGMPHRLAYSAAKAGIEGAVRVLAVEWAPDRVRVNAVAPSWTLTPLVRDAAARGHLDLHRLVQRMPLGRHAEPAEIAATIAFLVGSDASFVTGQTLLVDGAMTVGGPWPAGLAPLLAEAR